MLLRFSLLAPLFALAVQASNVLDLDSSNFDELVGKGKPGLGGIVRVLRGSLGLLTE